MACEGSGVDSGKRWLAMGEVWYSPEVNPTDSDTGSAAVLESAPPHRRRRAWLAALVAGGVALGAALSTLGYGAVVGPSARSTSNADPGRQYQQAFQNAASTLTYATAAQQVGVVDINTVLGYQGARAAGTGMILSSSGEILTNNHVIAGATSIKVTVVSTGRTYVAKVVGYDTIHDIAVLQLVGASGLLPARLLLLVRTSRSTRITAPSRILSA